MLPPDLLDRVPEDHVVWSILGAVEQMDLSAFYGAYRENGQGRAAYGPSMMGWRRCSTRTRAGIGLCGRSCGRVGRTSPAKARTRGASPP